MHLSISFFVTDFVRKTTSNTLIPFLTTFFQQENSNQTHAHTHTHTHTEKINLRKDLYQQLKQQILNSSKLKDFADNNYEVDENGGKFSKRVENTLGKGEIACYEQFLPFPQFFKKTCTADT